MASYISLLWILSILPLPRISKPVGTVKPTSSVYATLTSQTTLCDPTSNGASPTTPLDSALISLEDQATLVMSDGFKLLGCHAVLGHIPAIPAVDWAEPDYASYDEYVREGDNSRERLEEMRAVMEEYGIDAYIVPTADAHNSQYIAPTDARRVWLSGLEGSSGTVVVTSEQALVWTDGRYFTQFEIQVNTQYFTLMRQGIDLSIQNWLVQNMAPGSVVGLDPTTYTRNTWNTLLAALSAVNVTLRAEDKNLVDLARSHLHDPPPPRPNNPLIVLNVTYTGRASNLKLSELRQQMTERNAAVLILTALDDIAYTLNLRGSDIPYNPVFFSYLVIRNDVPSPDNLVLFWGNSSLPTDVEDHMQSEGTQLTLKPYEEVFDYIKDLVVNVLPIGSIVWLSQDSSHALYSAVETGGAANIISSLSPVALIKCVKNEVELQGFRTAHIKDGIAVVRGLRWVEEQVAAGQTVTELDLSDKLDELRRSEVGSYGPSFATIAGTGPNGAIIHYKPPAVGSRVISKDDMLLVDSGGQYLDGTTDITRTRHMSGSCPEDQKNTFTRVLKGQIMLGTAVFPRGTMGHTLETFARKALWDVGLNYAHGTGHGVGHFLNVHEGPSGILSGPLASDPGIVPGMIFSNEPGYYEVDQYGIRHEDLVEVIELNQNSDHIMAKGLLGNFSGVGALAFNYISLAPHQVACIDIDLLTDFEIQFLNAYHEKVLTTLGPILKERDLLEDYAWLERECARINAAILPRSSPFLLITIFSLWLGS